MIVKGKTAETKTVYSAQMRAEGKNGMNQKPGAREERHETKACLRDKIIVGEKRHEPKPNTQCKGRTA